MNTLLVTSDFTNQSCWVALNYCLKIQEIKIIDVLKENVNLRDRFILYFYICLSNQKRFCLLCSMMLTKCNLEVIGSYSPVHTFSNQIIFFKTEAIRISLRLLNGSQIFYIESDNRIALVSIPTRWRT